MSDLDYIMQEAKLTTRSGAQMVKRYGADTAKWPAGHWRNLLDRAATLSPPPPPPPTPTWDKLFTGGDFDSFARSLTDNQRGALGPGVTGTLTYALALDNSQRPAQNVTILSADPSKPGTVAGRIDIRAGLGEWTFDTVRIHESGARGSAGGSWVIASPVVFRQCDITNGNTKIGLITNPGSAGWKLARSRVHHVGSIFATEAEALQYGTAVYPYIDGTGWVDNHEHGVYTENPGEPGTVTDSVVEFCSDRGLQLRGGSGVVVQNTTVQNCGEGVIFGDMTTRDHRIGRSILRNNRIADRYLVESFGSDISGCIVDDNYIYNDDGRPAIQPGLTGVTVTNVHTGTPAAGYGPRFPAGC